MIPNSTCASGSVSAAVGSSRIRMRQSSVSALAISTSCWLEIESVPTSTAGSIGLSGASAARARSCSARVVHEPFPARVDLGHEDVLGHRHVRAERDLLVDEADPEFLRPRRRGDLHRLAVQDDLAAVGAQDAVDDVHQRGFPGAVLAGDGVHLAAAQLEVDAAQRLDRAERLADVGDFQDDLVGHDPRLRTGCARGRLWRSARRPQEATGAAAAAAQPRPSM